MDTLDRRNIKKCFKGSSGKLVHLVLTLPKVEIGKILELLKLLSDLGSQESDMKIFVEEKRNSYGPVVFVKI